MNDSYYSFGSADNSGAGAYYNQQQSGGGSKKKFIFIGLAALIIIGGITALVIHLANSSYTTDEDGSDAYVASLIDPGETDETLNPHLAETIKNAPNTDYQSNSEHTTYLSIPDSLLPFTEEDNARNDDTLINAAALSIILGRKVTASSIADSSLQEAAESYNINVTKVAAMNSNAINYHLDQGQIVIISGKGGDPFVSTGSSVLIYAAQPSLGLYAYYAPHQQCDSCDVPYLINKLSLFSALESDESFYVIGKAITNTPTAEELEHE